MNEAPYQKTTIVFPTNGDEILLGLKKRGFGAGWWNGFGGKLEGHESYEESAKRETKEEAGIAIDKLIHIADLAFYFGDELGVVSRAYLADYSGEPQETDEMRPQLFQKNNLPYENMWPADGIWLPEALSLDNIPRGFVVKFANDKSFRLIVRSAIETMQNLF